MSIKHEVLNSKTLKKIKKPKTATSKFEINDIVCVKPIPNRALDADFSFLHIEPMKVIDIYNNEYTCIELITGDRIKKYQSDLQLWTEIKDEIISKFKNYIKKLKNI